MLLIKSFYRSISVTRKRFLGYSFLLKKHLFYFRHEEAEISINTLRDIVDKCIILDGHLNHSLDIQGLLDRFHQVLDRDDRLGVVLYSPYVRVIYKFLNAIKLRKNPIPVTFITEHDLQNILKLSHFEIVKKECWFFPILPSILSRFINLLSLFNKFSLVNFYLLRPIPKFNKEYSVTIVIPARNEAGNIENALKRMPKFAQSMEIIFVEGNSTDNTWEEIERVCNEYSNHFSLRKFKQLGKGKNDAVRMGFSKANNDLLMILDADLTMPPEMLPSFYQAYKNGLGDFINGSRLVYPMEGEAMKFLNRLGNVFFAKYLSWILGVKLGDTLCGTKVVSKKNYTRFCEWRELFGDFDPFGDFELIFPASDMGLGIVEIPVHYKARTYGETNIRRFYHGFILLKMSLIGTIFIKLGFQNAKFLKAQNSR